VFRLSIVTPERPFFEDDCTALVVPGSEGYLGVLTDHAPLLTALKPGQIKLTQTEGSAQRYFAVSGGFFEVSHNHATILAESIEEPGAIDTKRAEAAMSRARQRLADRPKGLDAVRAEQALWRAKNRLEIARNHSN
jgi:F-type H+-transporting ATPase subunit epsilon